MKRREMMKLLGEVLPDWEVVRHIGDAAETKLSDFASFKKRNIVVVQYDPWLDTSDWWAYVSQGDDEKYLTLNHCRLSILPRWVVLHEAAHVLDGPNRFVRSGHNKRWRKIYRELIHSYGD